MTKFDLIIVGRGLAAQNILWDLANRELPPMKIAMISAPDRVNHCSTHSTSFVSPNGIRPGTSDLGDLMIEGVKSVFQFVEDNRPDGVEYGTHFSLSRPSAKRVEDFERRYGELEEFTELSPELPLSREGKGIRFKCLIFHDQKFMSWFEQQNLQRIKEKGHDLEVIDELVIEVKPKHILTTCENYCSDKIILCTGAGTTIYAEGLGRHESMTRAKVAIGSFYLYRNVELSEGFVMARHHSNLIYRKEHRELIIGATTVTDGTYAPKVDQLEGLKEELFELIPELKEILKMNRPEVITGWRHKGMKRRPFYGKIDDGVYGLYGLYKNGWSFPFYLAPMLLDHILGQEKF